MKLFKLEIERGGERSEIMAARLFAGREIVVHAESEEVARAHVGKRFKGWEITQCIEILGEAHFTVALLEPD